MGDVFALGDPSADEEKRQLADRKRIFKKASRVEKVRRNGGTLRYWRDYMAVVSGWYIYFYPAELEDRVKQLGEYRQAAREARKAGRAIEPLNPNAFKDLNHEEAYSMKGCNDVQLYSDYLNEVR